MYPAPPTGLQPGCGVAINPECCPPLLRLTIFCEIRLAFCFRAGYKHLSYFVGAPCEARPPKGVIFLPGVFLNDDDYNFDIALRRFKKQVEKAGILSEMKKRQHYEKPSVMRKKKKAAARKRLMKKMRKMNMA